jgi:hypothetical protein
MGAGAIKAGVDKAKAKPMEYAKNRGDSWREERRQKSKERVSEDKYFTKNPLSLFSGTADKFRSGQWDPLLGRKALTIGGRPIMKNSRRRERTVTGYKAGGAQTEEEDLKNAKLSNELEYGRQDESMAEDYQRLKANGVIGELDEHGNIKYEKNTDGTFKRDANGDKIAVKARNATVMEQRAALDKLAALGGEGNMAVIQRIHNQVLQTGDREQKRMMTKFKDANAQALFKKLPHLYKNYTYAQDKDVARTVDGLVPEDMTSLSGVGFAAMRNTLAGNIASARTALAADPNDADAQAALTSNRTSLKRLMTVLQQATHDENIKGHINADIARRAREFSVGDVGLAELQRRRQQVAATGGDTSQIDLQITETQALQQQMLAARAELMLDPDSAAVINDIANIVQEGTGLVTGAESTQPVVLHPGEIRIEHNNIINAQLPPPVTLGAGTPTRETFKLQLQSDPNTVQILAKGIAYGVAAPEHAQVLQEVRNEAVATVFNPASTPEQIANARDNWNRIAEQLQRSYQERLEEEVASAVHAGVDPATARTAASTIQDPATGRTYAEEILDLMPAGGSPLRRL